MLARAEGQGNPTNICDAGSVPDEQTYIRTEARRLLQRNAALTSPDEIRSKIHEFESRISLAVHYANPYPRFANVVPGATGERPTTAHPVYLHSYHQERTNLPLRSPPPQHND